MSFYTIEELMNIGLKSIGNDVKISRFANIYNPSNIIIGNNVRIDDFCILSSSNNIFIIEDNVHISAGVYIYGSGGIHIKSFSNISSGTKLFSVNDDYSGNYMVGACIPIDLRNVKEEPIMLEKYVVIGANCVVLPGIILNEGVAIGANSLVNKSCEEWTIYAGSPIRAIKQRSKKLLSI